MVTQNGRGPRLALGLNMSGEISALAKQFSQLQMNGAQKHDVYCMHYDARKEYAGTPGCHFRSYGS